MKKLLLATIVAGAFGCASSQKLENESRVHSLRADEAASARDYATAADEQKEAERLHAKAVEKAYKEGRAEDVTVPSVVPAPPNP